jgi:2-polyprenyl-3-methyl-5-hydroxy-6-metoxy-1,4-benzoquinol methylase
MTPSSEEHAVKPADAALDAGLVREIRHLHDGIIAECSQTLAQVTALAGGSGTDLMRHENAARHNVMTAVMTELMQRDNAIFNAVSQLAGRLDVIDNAVIGAQRMALIQRHGAVEIATDHPVAIHSPDHVMPWGTARDNSRNQRFNARLITLIANSHQSVLDLGCSGGGQVRSFIEQGLLSVGIEGSDYSASRLRAEWLTIPDFLFTADITEPFRLRTSRYPEGLCFGVVTLWEVIEHIGEAGLPKLFSNIDHHLLPGGLVIMSVSPNAEVIEGVELHQTVQPRAWWDAFFPSIGWRNHPGLLGYFGDDLVRWEANAPNSFHFVLSRATETPSLNQRARSLAG